MDKKITNIYLKVESSAARQMMKAIDGKKFKGRSIRMNDANSR